MVTITCAEGHDLRKVAKVEVLTETATGARVCFVRYFGGQTLAPELRFDVRNGKTLRPKTDRLMKYPFQCGQCKRTRWIDECDLADYLDDTPLSVHDLDLVALAATIASAHMKVPPVGA
jgi:hypothetical protein